MKLSELDQTQVKPVGTSPLRLSDIDKSKINVVEQTPTVFSELKKPNYFQRVGQSFKESGTNVTEAVKRGSSVIQNVQNEKGLLSPIQALKSGVDLSRTGLRVVGEVAGAAFSPITELPVIKQVFEKGAEQVVKVPGATELITEVDRLAKENPEIAKDAKAIFNIVTLGTGKAVSQPIKAEGKAIIQDAKELARVALTPSEESIQKSVIELFNKSIKPTSKKTLPQGERYQNQTLEALTTIKQNIDRLNIEDEFGELVAGRTPQNINELGQAVNQTKKLIFDEYDGLAKQANTLGAEVDAKPIADEVQKITQNKALQLTNPGVVKYAEEWSQRLNQFDKLDTETTQEVIKILNENLQAFYRNPSYDSASKVAVDALIVNNFRKSLDDVIEQATGEEYQALKTQYSALKAIEQDVVRAAQRDARKNVKGLIDYSDIFTSGQMIGGLFTLNPAMFTKGAVERGFKEYYKYLNDPNRAISNIFEQLDAVPKGKFVPTSATGKYIQDPKLGLGIKAVGMTAEDIRFDNVTRELSKLDNTPLKVNGQIDLSNSDDTFRLEQLKNKVVNSNKALSKDEVIEADTLLKKIGIDANNQPGNTVKKPRFIQDPKTGKLAGSKPIVKK